MHVILKKGRGQKSMFLQEIKMTTPPIILRMALSTGNNS